MAHQLSGVIPPLVTPLTEAGEVDTASYKRLVDRLVDAGVSGLFVCGSTSEVALLSDRLRDDVVRAAVDAAAGRVPVLAGVIDTGTLRMIDHAKRAVALGAKAIVATPPFYIAPNPAEIIEHYRALAKAVSVPVIAYNIPSATQVGIPMESLDVLAHEGTISALKDSGGDIMYFRTALETVGDSGIGMLTGSEVFADLALELGGTGIVPGIGNVDPYGYVTIQKAAEAGDWETARKEQERLIKLFEIVNVADLSRIGFTAGALGSFKMALYQLGVIDHPTTCAPMLPLNDAESDIIRQHLVDAGLKPVR
ncbi:MAG: dihydrodipicolinate synthase family protein [Bifidobacteriaceae bacterium]|jgi:4-hydroxy-tetrahydrodipicolinate synthase|nr:dihydrodipicolinate synthase family protein [Bifidobacteriaceae bacterium]